MAQLIPNKSLKKIESYARKGNFRIRVIIGRLSGFNEVVFIIRLGTWMRKYFSIRTIHHININLEANIDF